MADPEVLPTVDVCICTFRRESLSTTLASIDAQIDVGAQVRILVADNDDHPTAKDRVGDSARWPRHYIHAPARNISIARNALLDASTADFVAWIDDDEIARPDWLSGLLHAVGEHDAAFGPVKALYPSEAAAWIRVADLHSTEPVTTRRGVITGYTSNALVRRSAIGEARFLEALGRSGGEDTEFFTRLHHQGRRFTAASDAVVEEPTASDRLSLRWLASRAFRAGQTHARTDIASGRRSRGTVIAALKAAFCLTLCLAFAWHPVKRRRLWVRAALHRGVVARLLGGSDLQLY